MNFFEDTLGVVPRVQPIEQSGSFWRKDAPDIDKEGRVKRGGLFPHQKEWWDLKNYIRVLVGGYGSGKTISLCKRMISLALENAPAPVATLSPTFPVARETIIRTMKELCAGKRSIHGRAFFWRYNTTFHSFTVRYHGREGTILVYSSDHPESLRGPNLAAAGIDEPFIQEEEAFKQMIARVRHPQSRHREINLTGTPEQLNWGYDLCEGDLKAKHDVGIVQASTRSNLALPADYVARLESAYGDKEAEAFIEGHFVNLAAGLVYYAFSPQDNIVGMERPDGSTLGVGMDFNVNPMAVVVFWVRGEHMHIFAEQEFPNADTEYVAQALKEKYWDQGLRDIYPDASGAQRHTNAPGGKSDFHYLEEAGFTVNCHDANPLRKDRYNAVNGKLKSRRDRVTLTVSPRCTKLKKYLSVVSHELMNTPAQKRMGHLLDALGYPVAYLFPVSKDHLDTTRLGGY